MPKFTRVETLVANIPMMTMSRVVAPSRTPHSALSLPVRDGKVVGDGHHGAGVSHEHLDDEEGNCGPHHRGQGTDGQDKISGCCFACPIMGEDHRENGRGEKEKHDASEGTETGGT